MKRTLIFELTPAQDAKLVEKATGNDTPETLGATIISEWCQGFVTADEDAAKLAMASNERLMALGTAVMAQPEKFEAVEAAVLKALS